MHSHKAEVEFALSDVFGCSLTCKTARKCPEDKLSLGSQINQTSPSCLSVSSFIFRANTDNHSHSHSHSPTAKLPSSLMCLSLDCWRKLETPTPKDKSQIKWFKSCFFESISYKKSILKPSAIKLNFFPLYTLYLFLYICQHITYGLATLEL